MVALATKGPIVTINDDSVAASKWLIRTQAALPAVRLACRGRMMVAGGSAPRRAART
jgi:hypothetical protein